MAKRSKKVRPQEYPDHDELEDVKPGKKYAFEMDEEEMKALAKSSFGTIEPAAYREGDVVTCPDKQKFGDGEPKTGTVVMCVGKDLLILDAQGVIHQCKAHEVYPAQ